MQKRLRLIFLKKKKGNTHFNYYQNLKQTYLHTISVSLQE